ncbi:glutaminase [Paenibacillus montanisoli]|uniref:Glutaminase n=2 Tax=Paenibacillus montanisoli TaxID=2081970 RepID=A0A328TTH3_9BACL|nr:glutaminase family protein [Paenibacillus montanisoli]RAP73889.1 glutaminase [Paenibacillus montanisoli]
MNAIRPSSVPLVTIDPYFSVWSNADRLTDDFTRHWTGQRHAMTGLIRIDGTVWRFAGLAEPNAERYYPEAPAMKQTGLTVSPLSTVYTFEASGVTLTVRFTSPLLLDDLDVLSRPASYVAFEVFSADGRGREVSIYFDVTGEWCVDHPNQAVISGRAEDQGLILLQMAHERQDYMNRSGDDHRIDWGQFYLGARQSGQVKGYLDSADLRKRFARNEALVRRELPAGSQVVRDSQPVMALVYDLGSVGGAPVSELAVIAYDDVYAVEYFGEKLQAYWKRNGQTAAQMIAAAFADYESLLERCAAFDRQLLADAVTSGGSKYADILALSYRQSIAAHKLVLDTEGELLFLSKECYSNGCMATVDVSYPSVPLYLLYNPALVEGMIRPIVKYAESEKWPFDFAPHDIGQYPLGNGQVYSENAIEGQMPVEECGNMLVMAAATALASGKTVYLFKHMDLFAKWANYLAENGLDPANQLCTDDFAGHLARNANLSVKAVMGVASFSILKQLQGDEGESERYLKLAQDMAAQWAKLADDGDHTKLAFGQDGTWSLKYNLIWDQLFEIGLFEEETIRAEVAWYLKQRNVYGTPLDSRATYTKSDWLLWSATLAERQNDFERLIEPVWRMLNDTPNRVPFSDWTDTLTARQLNFQHRSVVGGMFIKLLKDKGILRARL